MKKPEPGDIFKNKDGIKGIINKWVFNPKLPETEVEILYPNGAVETHFWKDLTFKKGIWLEGEIL